MERRGKANAKDGEGGVQGIKEEEHSVWAGGEGGSRGDGNEQEEGGKRRDIRGLQTHTAR